MPLYDFHCRSCDKTFELLVLSDTRKQCPACASEAVEKLVSAPPPPPRSGERIAAARAQANREGHFSNYSAAERRRIKP